MVGTPELDTVLEVCGHKHRRIVLATLDDPQESVPITDLTDAIIEHNHHMPPAAAADETVTQIRTGLHHTHLPKLVAAGLIEYDRTQQLVEPRAQLEQAESQLSTILAMDSELPSA
jgi:hypothetical protein